MAARLLFDTDAQLGLLTRIPSSPGTPAPAMGLDEGMASRARLRAPELVGAGGWLNTGGKDLSLADFRGKIVIADFWTFS
ncbi:hypothetical protein ACFVUN_30200 [Kitasatospora griseola]|uniref:hypothetical protein n=1 Tax=Kitasatospora griseola TaxID=2064 RepID=UPI0036D77D47